MNEASTQRIPNFEFPLIWTLERPIFDRTVQCSYWALISSIERSVERCEPLDAPGASGRRSTKTSMPPISTGYGNCAVKPPLSSTMPCSFTRLIYIPPVLARTQDVPSYSWNLTVQHRLLLPIPIL